ncbi:MAG: efflux RND transporter periplasmic adaptor subunit [Candidatus Omnitrophica bacterium]|jgi:macrolide-specific efflux system membrane fusion protein|nr:efflux RND transporter periplasmic adaptor subunit [Candidatus Omnitrophota bacterium]
MRNKTKLISGILILAAVLAVYLFKVSRGDKQQEAGKEIRPFIGDIQNTVSTTGTVLPRNRLEVKPPVNGRVEQILVKEGEQVKTGQTLGWMSSTERAALLDVARGQGEEKLKYWQEVYKAIPLVSPIDGEVIVQTTQPGQTVTTSDAVVVLSDQLIVRAQADETDIGKLKLGQKAVITLDAYPDIKVKAFVNHIYYESTTENNVTIYKVDLVPENIPDSFRSGMNASIDFIIAQKDNALIIEQDAVFKKGDKAYVFVKTADSQPEKREIKLGLSDDKNYEVVSGISAADTVLVQSVKYSLPKDNSGTNPFMPFRNRQNRATQSAK